MFSVRFAKFRIRISDKHILTYIFVCIYHCLDVVVTCNDFPNIIKVLLLVTKEKLEPYFQSTGLTISLVVNLQSNLESISSVQKFIYGVVLSKSHSF